MGFSSSHSDKCALLYHYRFPIHPSSKKHILLQQQITRRCLCFPHSYLLSSFPFHMSHLRCNRLSPFAVAPAFMENVPQGDRVIVCLFLKAGVKSKDLSWMHRTRDVGVQKQQSTIFHDRHRSDMFFLANRSQACCFGEHDEVFDPIYHIFILSHKYHAPVCYIFLILFFFLLSIIVCVCRS